MTKEQLKKSLNKIVKESSCYNEVASRFLEVVCLDHIDVDPNSCDPEMYTEQEKKDVFKYWIIKHI